MAIREVLHFVTGRPGDVDRPPDSATLKLLNSKLKNFLLSPSGATFSRHTVTSIGTIGRNRDFERSH